MFYGNMFILVPFGRHIHLQQASTVMHTIVWGDQQVENLFSCATARNQTQKILVSNDFESCSLSLDQPCSIDILMMFVKLILLQYLLPAV